MSQRTYPERASSSRSAHIRRERQEQRGHLRLSRSQGHRRMNILTMHSSIRRPLSRSHIISPQSQPSEASESELSRQGHPGQEQFINGQPTASLNGQHPSILRTFRFSTQNGQYEAETTPNIAYIERTSSLGTNSLRSHDATLTYPSYLERYTMSEPRSTQRSFDLERLRQQRESTRVPLISDTSNRSDCYQEQRSIAQVLPAVSEKDFCSEATRGHSDAGTHANTPPGRRPISYPSRYRRVGSRTLMTRSPVKGVNDRGRNVVDWVQTSRQDYGPIVEDDDYFGDSIAGQGRLCPPIPARSPYRTRSSTPELRTARAVRLFAANPDPPSGSTTEDDLPLRPSSLGITRPEPSYRSRRPIEPRSDLYPSPLRPQTIKRQASGISQRKAKEPNETPVQAHPSRASRRVRFFPTIHWKYNRDRQDAQEDEDLTTNILHNTASSHWAFNIVQGFVWLGLVVYLFWRISTLGKTVSFDCYDLKMKLLHLVGENITLPLVNSTASNSTFANGTMYPPANATFYTLAERHTNASAVVIPPDFRAKVRSHCILEPVNPAVVLASHFEVLFLMMLVSCGLAHVLQLLVLQQVRTRMRKSGALGARTLMIRVAVQIFPAGFAILGVLGTAWGIRGGVW
ncbi:uncharacterized protein CC84DRAFT_316306 [Paraphaeosphaeria sporulosa]|uniref:Uncharacterized protein n=1 Tax=Paraphaeosphaeria sporulosa TaxID=1460663 RepID=A0A177C044_9PLEO|nr:uncharacterized protein CC84DRAFT_316306 [Paraphaeosphaeria sporulosa]OAG00611.1 hypothetical protein CC84DRAFT_316306 [Paraphaeosphaeria sporulosa]